MDSNTVIEGNNIKYVYLILCLSTKKAYIGITNNFKNRKRQHIQSLNNGKHHSKILQIDWDKNGQDTFYFSIVEATDNIDREKHWIDFYNSINNGYNEFYGRNPSDAVKINISKSNKGKTLSESHKKLLSIAKLTGTSNNKPVISIDEKGNKTEYIGVGDACRKTKSSLGYIYDSLQNKPKKWRKKPVLKWIYKPEIS